MENVPRPTNASKPTPVHQRLIEDVAALRRLADPIIAKIRRIPQVRPMSPEAQYLRFLAIALEDADYVLGMAQKYGGAVEIVFTEAPGPDRINCYRIFHREPPSKVTDLTAYRLERARRAAS